MSILFSRQCEYALQAVSYLAIKPEGEMVPIRALSKALRIPYHFLAKILQNLAAKGLLTSQKGPAGGFALAMPSEKITLLHIVEAIDGLGFMHDCMMGFATCSGKNPCAAHETWANVRGQVHEMLVNQSVAEIARGMRKPVFVAGR